LYRLCHNENAKIPFTLVKKFAIDTARGMVYLHNSKPVILHRDLKSHNLLVDEHYKVKISDFGLSKVMDPQSRTMTSCGTAAWAAPEILKNSRYTEKADVYSYGICLWEFFTRSDPYEGMPVFQIIFSVGTEGLRPSIPDNCPPDYAALMRECWDVESTNRPSFAVILQRLGDLDSGVGGPEQLKTALELSRNSKNEDVEHSSEKSKENNLKAEHIEIIVNVNKANEVKYPQLNIPENEIRISSGHLQPKKFVDSSENMKKLEEFEKISKNDHIFESTTVS